MDYDLTIPVATMTMMMIAGAAKGLACGGGSSSCHDGMVLLNNGFGRTIVVACM